MRLLKDLSYGPHGERNLLDLYLPEQHAAPLPLVICIHGGGWTGGSKEVYEWLGKRVTDLGMAAASITYRLWPQWRCPAAIDDAQRAARWLRRNAARYGLDLNRFGAMGGSAGAHLASYLGLAQTRDNGDAELAGFSSRVACVVDCYGPVDFPAMMASASAPIVEGFMGMPYSAQTEAAYREASPFHLVAPVPPPFLLLHGTEDVGVEKGQVPLSISERFAEKLRQAGGDATLVRLEGAPHGFTARPDSPHALAAWDAAAPFLERHLGNRQAKRR